MASKTILIFGKSTAQFPVILGVSVGVAGEPGGMA